MTSTLRSRARTLLRAAERIVWGGATREKLLVKLLRQHYASVMRRQWREVEEPPHFFDHRIGSFAFAAGDGTAFGYYRGYLAAEVIRKGDRLLDIGCGDGFFVRRFFSPKSSEVDAIDVEPSAIEHAKRHNAAQGVSYRLCDAANEPFPSDRYDVIVWDGGLGHFAPEATGRVLEKIRAALSPDGVFVGSESLGHEGHDHLQFFSKIEELCRLFRPFFPHVQLRTIAYELPGLLREEAFWRCAFDPLRLEEASWKGCVSTDRIARERS